MNIGEMFHFQERKAKSIEEDNSVMDRLLEYNPQAKLLDVGCGDGRRTVRWAKCIGTKDIIGMDAKNFGQPFKLVEGDIDGGLPFANETFDVVISHHVIEHVSDTDQFVSEIYRVLKSGGYAGITTPNMAAGKVIAELLINRQPLWAHVSDWFFVNNTFTDEILEKHRGFLHRRLFTVNGLASLLEHYGFKIEHKKRHGYGVLSFGKILRGLYAANITMIARKGDE